MPTIPELVTELHDKRRKLIEAQRETHSAIEVEKASGGEAAELEGTWKAQDSKIVELGESIDRLIKQDEHNREMDTQREALEKLTRTPNAMELSEKSENERLRTWLRAGMEGAEVYVPPIITLSLRNSGFGMYPGLERMAQKAGLDPRGATEFHDMTKGSATAGGHTVPTSFVRKLYEHLVDASSVRQTNAEVLRTDSGENLTVPMTTSHGAAAAIIAEGGTFTEADPAGTTRTLGAFKYGKLIDVSNELLEDTAVDLTGYLARAAGLAVGLGNNAHLVTGTGTGQPEGIANAPTAGVTLATGQTTTINSADSLIDLFHSVNPLYRRNAFWIMNDATAAILRKLKDTTNQYIWQASIQAGLPDTILGKPVVTDPNMATAAANAFTIAFGDFSLYYVIRDVDGVQFKRSDEFRFDVDLVSFRVRFRTDAKQLINGASGAVKFLRQSAT